MPHAWNERLLRVSRSPAIHLLGLCALAAAVRLYGLGRAPVWLDEANIVDIAQHSLRDQIALLRQDSAPPLYSFLLRYWMLVFGSGEVAVRMLSVVGGVALVGCTYWVGRRVFSPFVGLAAGALMAVNPSQIGYSQEARPYALAALACLLATYWFSRLLATRRTRDACAFAIALLAALYLHNYALLLAVALAFWWLAVRGWRLPLRANLAATAIVIVGYLPWLPTFVAQWQHSEFLWWFDYIWREWALWTFPVRTLVAFVAGSPWTTIPGAPPPGWWPAVVLATALLTILAVAPRLLDKRAPWVDTTASAWTAMWVLPMSLALVSSAFADYPHYISGRVDQLFLPAFVLVLAVGISRPRPLAVRVALLAACLVYSCAIAHRQLEQQTEGYTARELAASLAPQLTESDTLIFTSGTRAEVEYYLRRDGVRATILSFPAGDARSKGSSCPSELDDVAKLTRELDGLRPYLRRSLAGKTRLFVECTKPLFRNQELFTSWLLRTHEVKQINGPARTARRKILFGLCEMTPRKGTR